MDGKELQFSINMTAEFINAVANRVVEINNTKITPEPSTDLTFTVKEVARLLGRSEATIGKHIRMGLLKAKKVGKSYIITENNFNNYKNGE